ncbi:hypothetical protein FRC03_002130 [Tulasnella sp. 419]|nr:hypothetical protein FRC03_002130 [Tulasnella sp. 419]
MEGVHATLTRRASAFSFRSLNWLLLVLCSVIVIVASFFLFYWNRLLGWLLGFAIRFLFWKKHNVWVECEACQLSLLAGRIVLKDVQYHSRNMSIKVIKCHITWRYWLWRVRDTEDLSKRMQIEPAETPERSLNLPCRIHVVLEGFEVFFYNRTQAYDDIISQLQSRKDGNQEIIIESTNVKEGSDHQTPHFSSQQREGNDTSGNEGTPRHEYPPQFIPSFGPLSRAIREWADWLHGRIPTVNFQDFLPLAVEATRCALVLGNDSAPSVFIADIKKASGTYSIAASRSPLDEYKNVYAFKLSSVKLITRQNPDYEIPMSDRGNAIFADLRDGVPDEVHEPHRFLSFDVFRRLATLFPGIIRRTTPPPAPKWRGLARYMTEAQRREAGEFAHELEYAKVTTLLETKMLEATYFVDAPGLVPENARALEGAGKDVIDVGNGGLPPEWGVELIMHGGNITWGPWADRQRDAIQRAMFPASYSDNNTKHLLKAGDLRVHTALTFLLEIRESVTFRLPTREPSKDWRFDGSAAAADSRRQRDQRPFGWIDVSLGASSTLRYTMSMVADAFAFPNSLEVHLNKPVLSSSVNGARFLSTVSCRILCKLPSPRKWNNHREWIFDISFAGPNIHLLRDHATLITDLINDWTTGPPSDYNTFIPITYIFKFSLRDYRINLYLNEHNIIDHPLADDYNSLLILTGPSFDAQVDVPSTRYRPYFSSTPFWIEASNVAVSISLPVWNTHRTFNNPSSTSTPLPNTQRSSNDSPPISLGNIGLMRLDASYLSYSEVREGNTEKLKLDFHTRQALFTSHAWSIRYFLNFRDNYFGNFTNFCTLAEYLDRRNHGELGDPIDAKYREGQSNVFDVSLALVVEGGIALLPAELYGCRSAVALQVPELQVVLRLQEYFMELSLNLQPVVATLVRDCTGLLRSGSIPATETGRLVVDGIDILANRLLGPQPRTSTYACIWEIQIGRIYGVLAPEFASCLSSAANVLGVNYADDLNAPSSEFAIPLDNDVTFLKLHISRLDVAIRSSKAAVQLCINEGIALNYNDLASSSYSQVTSICIPSIDAKTLAHQGGGWFEVASFSCDVNCDIYSSPAGWKERARLQVQFITEQDELTRRMAFVYGPDRTSAPSHLEGLFVPGLFALPQKQPRPPNASFKVEPSHRRPSFSESEDDEKLSDGALETFVALSRAETPRPSGRGFIGHPYTDGSLSSGDESDNVSDSQDTVETGSELSDAEDTKPKDKDWSYLENLRHALNRYRATELQLLADSSPFVLVEGSLLQGLDSGPGWTLDPNLTMINHAASDANPLEDDSIDLSIVRFRSGKPVSLFFSTPVIAAVRSLHGSFQQVETPAEHHLDSLFISYLAKVKSISALSGSRTILDVSISCMTVNVLQSVNLSSEQTPRVKEEDNLLAIARLQLDAVSLIMDQRSLIQDDPSAELAASFQRMTSSLSDITLESSVSATAPSRSLVEIELCASSIAFQMAGAISCAVSLGETTATLDDSSPIPLARSVHGLVRLGSKLASTATKISGSQSRTQLLLVQEILRLYPDRSILDDPLSWVSTFLMVKSGLPRRLRTDLSWKILAHTRHCLRDMSTDGQNDLSARLKEASGASSGASPDTLARLGKDLLARWNHDTESDPLDLALLQVFKRDTSGPSDQKPPWGLLVDWSSLQVTVVGSEKEDNVLTLGPLHLRIQCDDRHQQSTFPSELEEEVRSILHFLIVLNIDHVRLDICPSFMPFLGSLQQSLVINQGTSKKQSRMRVASGMQDMLVEAFVEIRGIDLRASALDVLFNIRQSQLNITSSLDIGHEAGALRMSGGTALTMAEFSVRARLMKASDQDVLAAIFVRRAACHASFSDSVLDRSIAVALGVQEVRLNVPRSALRLYKIATEWRKAYMATYEPIVQGLLAGIEKRSPSSPTQDLPSSTRPIKFDVQVFFKLLGATLQVMHGTWLTWDFQDTTVFAHGGTGRSLNCAFGLNLDSQVLKLSVHPLEHHITEMSSTSIRLPFPSFKITGSYDGTGIRALSVLGFISFSLKPKFIDDILTVQQHLGNDFNEWLDLYADTRRRPSSETVEPGPTFVMPFKVEARFDGFRVALEGPSSTQFVDAAAVIGELKREQGPVLRWAFKVTSLSLSLAHHSIPHSNRPMFDRKYRSAYMIVEFDANNHSASDTDNVLQHLNIRIQRVHAVFQAAALGELGDLVDYVQAEMLLRKDQRAAELAGFRNKSQRIMIVLEREASLETSSPSWLDNLAIAVRIDSVGMALPLKLDNEFMYPRNAFRPSHLTPSSVKAFLFSIHSIDFATRKYESGHAHITDFSFQFVDNFDQSNPGHFEGRTHITRNRMRFPYMSATITSQTKELSRGFDANAIVSGFELDLDPSIVNYIFSLVDVYRQGKQRIEKLAPGQARANLESLSARVSSTQAVETHYLNDVNSNVVANFEFNEGKIRLFGPESFSYEMVTQSSYYDVTPEVSALPSDGILSRVDEFDLPNLHIFARFNAASASQKFASKTDGPPLSDLFILTTISTSHNVIKPSVLPFAVEVVRQIETRLRHSQVQMSQTTASTSQLLSGTEASTPSVISATDVLGGRLQLTFKLNINESNLELTCLPDVNVVAGLKWQSGTLVVTVQPNAREISVFMTFVGLNVGLRHGYLQEDAVTAEAKKLNIGLAISKFNRRVDEDTNNVSVTVNTEIATHIAFQRLQDVLCFKAVWLDRIPVFDIRPVQQSEVLEEAPPSATIESHPNRLTMSIVVRIGSLDVVADLGTYISKVELSLVNLDINSTQLRTSSELLVSLKSLELRATEALSGHLRIPGSSFKAIRRKRPHKGRAYRNFSLLEITINMGTLDMLLAYERACLLIFHSDPICATVTDDWSTADEDDQAIRLDYSLSSGEITARGALRAAPELIGLAARVKAVLIAQKESAAKESKAFRTTLQPKPANPLSEVASSMLQAARSKFKETEERLDIVFVQHMQFALDKIQIELIDGQKLSNIHALSIKAELERQVQTCDHIPKRDLRLSLGKLDVSTWLADGDPRVDLDITSIQPSLKEVFAFPRLEIEMTSVLQKDLNRLDYHFTSTFPDQHEVLRDKGLYLVLDWVQYDDLMRLKTSLEEQIQLALTDPVFHSNLTSKQTPGVPDRMANASQLASSSTASVTSPDQSAHKEASSTKVTYRALSSKVDTPVLRQLGDAKINPGAFKRMTGINVKESLPIWVHEYATIPIESIMTLMLDIYARRLKKGKKSVVAMDSESETDDDDTEDDHTRLDTSIRLAEMQLSLTDHDMADGDGNRTPRTVTDSAT